MDKNSIVKQWHDFANDDLVTAKYLLGLHPLKLDNADHIMNFIFQCLELSMERNLS